MCDLICKNLMDILRADMLARAIVERKTWVKFKNKFLNSMKEGVNRKNYDRTSTLIRNLLHISSPIKKKRIQVFVYFVLDEQRFFLGFLVVGRMWKEKTYLAVELPVYGKANLILVAEYCTFEICWLLEQTLWWTIPLAM